MKLHHIFAVTICIDDEKEETYHIHRSSGTPPEREDLAPKILPLIRRVYHPASDFEIIAIVDVQNSLDIFNQL